MQGLSVVAAMDDLPMMNYRLRRGLPRLPKIMGSFAINCVPRYICTMINESQLVIERVQTGVRMEKRLLKVLKALAEYHDMSLGDLLEGIVLHAFDGKTAFSPASLKRINDLKKFYALDLNASASHRLSEAKHVPLEKKVAHKRDALAKLSGKRK